jgi:hypothetical protein
MNLLTLFYVTKLAIFLIKKVCEDTKVCNTSVGFDKKINKNPKIYTSFIHG